MPTLWCPASSYTPVSTNIQRHGSKIEMNNIGCNQSEQARKAIELQFGLTKAEGRGQKQENELKSKCTKSVVL